MAHFCQTGVRYFSVTLLTSDFWTYQTMRYMEIFPAPSVYGKCHILEFMDHSSNSLSGVVPFSSTPNRKLQSLHLANKHFRGTFPDLGDNNFSGGIPSWISKSLPKLRFLRLSSNMFDSIIPSQILQFRQLQVKNEFRISGNMRRMPACVLMVDMQP